MRNFINNRPVFLSASNVRRRGIALISVLWLVALLSVLTLAILALARNDRLIAHRALDQAAAEGWADAGVFLTIHRLCDSQLVKEVPVDGRIISVNIAGQRVDVATQDELGKIDINFAPKELLQNLLLSAGASADDSSRIAGAIDEKRLSNAKNISNEIMLNGSKTNTDNFTFHTLEELKSIPGMTDDLFRQLRPAITVYSQQAAVKTATAPREVLRALPGMNEQQIDSIMAARANNPITAGGIGLNEGTAGQNPLTGRPFTIYARAQVGKNTFIRRAVVVTTGDARQPYKILDWSVDIP